MKKVAFITTHLGVGGAEKQWFELIKNINHETISVVIICLKTLGPIGVNLKRNGVVIYENVVGDRFKIFGCFRLIKILKKEKIDVVFLMNSPLVFLYGLLAAKVSRVKKVVTAIHATGYLNRKLRGYLSNMLFAKFIDFIVALSEEHKKYLHAKCCLPLNKIIVIHNGVDINEFMRNKDVSELRHSLGISDDYKIVGMISRLHPLKRHDVFLQAAALVIQEYKNAFFLIIGDGPEKERITTQIKRLGMQGKVKLLGLRNDIAELNHILDVSVLVSDTEALPMSLIESMASGVPVVATKVGSIPELVVDKVTGILIPTNSPIDTSKAILTILNNPNLGHRFGEEGRRQVEEKFSTKNMVKAYEALFLN